MIDRRVFLQDAAAAAVAIALPGRARKAEPDLAPVFAQIAKRHDEGVERLQQWIRQPSIAAENRGMNEGCELTMRMLREAGFGQVTKLPTDGQPGIFATLDAGAPRTLGLYFMYDVKQADPAEWTSPPWEAALVDRPGLGKVLVGRGAVNQKGPEAAFLGALHAIRGAGRKPPVNFVLVAEGEEEIGSPHFPQDRTAAGGARGAQAFHRHLHALRRPGTRRTGDHHARRQGRDRMRADRERRALGPRAAARHSFEQQGTRGQPGVAPGAGTRDTGVARR